MAADFYKLDSSHSVIEYIDIGDALSDLEEACIDSDYHLIDGGVLVAEVDPDSGDEFPDFIYHDGVPLISEKMKTFFERQKIDQDSILYKKIILKKSSIGKEEVYWLALPRRIDCLDYDKSDVDPVLEIANKIQIIKNLVGRYKIFKLAGVTNLEIIITADFAEALKQQHFEGVHIIELK